MLKRNNVSTHKNSTTKAKLLFVFLFVCFCSLSVYAQKFYAQVGCSTVPMGQTIEVAFIAENANVRGFSPPAFKDFQVVGGPNQSSSTTFMNGTRSSTMSFSYYLSPKHEGACIIEAASLKTENSVFNSSQIKITVTKASAVTKANNNNNNNQSIANISTEDISKSVFIKTLTNKSEAYIGEPISATFRLYTDRQLFNVQFPKAAAFNGFWKHDIAIDQNQPWNYENIDGKRYAYIDVQKAILFPQKAGQSEVTPIGMEAVIQQQSKRKARSFYEELFGGNVSVNEIPIKLKSKTISIKVKGFPKNQPVGFNGVVGAYTLVTSIDKTETKVNEPIILRLKITGNGGFQSIEAPILHLPTEFEIYDPQTKESTSLNGATISGSKIFEYLIVPREPGIFELPSNDIVCFNPETQQFYTLATPIYKIKVTGDTSLKKTSLSGDNLVRKIDLSPINPVLDSGQNQSNLLFNSKVYYSFFVSPLILFLGLLLIKKRNESSKKDVIKNRKRKASKVAFSRLSVAHNYLQDNKRSEFYNEVNKTMLEFLSHKLDIAFSDINRNLITSKLTEKQVEQLIIDRCLALMDKTEIALYSQSDGNHELQNTYNESLDLVAVLEEKLK